MKTKTKVRAGDKQVVIMQKNHNKKLVVKAGVRAGALSFNHNKKLVVKTRVRAGALSFNHNKKLVTR
jgi:hypothetical protein